MGLVPNPLILSPIHFHKCQHAWTLVVGLVVTAGSDLTQRCVNYTKILNPLSISVVKQNLSTAVQHQRNSATERTVCCQQFESMCFEIKSPQTCTGKRCEPPPAALHMHIHMHKHTHAHCREVHMNKQLLRNARHTSREVRSTKVISFTVCGGVTHTLSQGYGLKDIRCHIHPLSPCQSKQRQR